MGALEASLAVRLASYFISGGCLFLLWVHGVVVRMFGCCSHCNAGGELTAPGRCKIKLSTVICGRISRALLLGMIRVNRLKTAGDTSSRLGGGFIL